MNDAVSAREIRDFRRETLGTFTETANIYQPPDPNTGTRTSGGFVSQKFPDDWTKLNADPAACAVLRPKFRAEEKMGAGQVQATSRRIPIRFAAGTNVDEKCRVQILSSKFNASLVGNTYDVIEVEQVSLETFESVLCDQVK